MTKLAQTLSFDFAGDIESAIRYALKVAVAYRHSGQGGDAIQYEAAAASLANHLLALKASAEAGSFDLGMIP